jgi:hypothetical protein
MKALVLAIAALVAAVSTRAAADPLLVVVRDGGGGDALAVARLRGQLADLDVSVTIARGAVEPALGVQLAAATRLAGVYRARAVVWFVARDGGLAVAIATPGDRRLFVREIPSASASAVAEAAAVAARGAIRAIQDGGRIGVEVPAVVLAPAPAVVAVVPAPPELPRTGFELLVGWQVALDAGADIGAQAVAQRTSVTRGAWAGSLALSLGPALRHTAASDVAVELSRSGATLGIERRAGGFAFGVAAGALAYHRTTISTQAGLAPTPAAITAAFVAGPEVRWQWRSRELHLGIDAVVGLDVVLGAPELAVVRGDAIEPLGQIRRVQPRFGLSIVAGLP